MKVKESHYFEIRVPCQSSEVDDIEMFLLNSGACSVTFRDAKDMAILEPAPGQMPLWVELEITAMYSHGDVNQNSIFNDVVSNYSDRNIECNNLANQVWERTWLKHFKPMKFGTKTWVVPTEFEPIDESAINIVLDPGLAFGTGTHATTALCLEWIDAQKLTNSHVIDFGCGSGILAIAAVKHGANKVYCTDIDPQAIESTLANCTQNEVQEAIVVVLPEKVKNLCNLDVVIANILAAPLMELVKTFHGILKPHGELLMSGILTEQTDEIIEIFSPYFIDFQINIKEDWVSVYAKKSNDNL